MVLGTWAFWLPSCPRSWPASSPKLGALFLLPQDEFERGALLEGSSAASSPVLWWSPPPLGYTKLNVDGSFHHSSGSMAIGGVLRASDGSWIWGFSAKCGFGSILEAELLALETGLQHAWDRDIRNLLCESDSLEVIQLLNLNNNSLIDPYSALVNEIRVLLAKPWDVRISHIFREANLLADHLARWLHHRDDSVMLWNYPPQSALEFLVANCCV
ncbi:Ribonuclease H domain [Sesbania bispinosa]|nr:Ribonuclease H domain [Sesbania bispinosa]